MHVLVTFFSTYFCHKRCGKGTRVLGGDRVVIGSTDRTAGVWDLGSGARLHTLQHGGPVIAMNRTLVSRRLAQIVGTAWFGVQMCAT